MIQDNKVFDAADDSHAGAKMPAIFIGHGNPMHAIEDSTFSHLWTTIGRALPRPRAILCISAHWETIGTRVTAMDRPRTLHDFAGFPQALFDVKYPAPGSPALAGKVQSLANTPVTLDYDWGLDHGAWSVLCRLFPAADVPIVQLSLDSTKTLAAHYALGQSLRALRNQGVLIVGSGNIVHNLGAVVWKDTAYDWALRFDEQIKHWILAGDHTAILHFDRLGAAARLAVPTSEHYLPLLYCLAQQEPGETVTFFAETVTLGAIGMRSLLIGAPIQL